MTLSFVWSNRIRILFFACGRQDEERCHDNTYALSLASNVGDDEDEDELLSPLSKALTAEQRTQLVVSRKQLLGSHSSSSSSSSNVRPLVWQTYHGTEETRKPPHVPTSAAAAVSASSTSSATPSFRDHIESVLSSSAAASASSRHAFNYEHMRALATATARARIRL